MSAERFPTKPVAVLAEQRGVSTNAKALQEKGLIYCDAQSRFWLPPPARLDVDAPSQELLFSIERKMRMRYLSKGSLCEARVAVR